MALVQAGRWTLTDLIDVQGADGEPQPGSAGRAVAPRAQKLAAELPRAVTVHVGSARSVARVRPLGPGWPGSAWPSRCRCTSATGCCCAIRVAASPAAGRRVAGAVVLDVAPPPLRRRGAAAAAARQLACWPDQPGAADLLARHGLLKASTLLAMGIADHPVPVTGEWLADPEHWRAARSASSARCSPVTRRASRCRPACRSRRRGRRSTCQTGALSRRWPRPPFQVACGALRIARPAGPAGRPDLPEAVLAAVRVLRADLAAAPFLAPDADRLRKLGLDARSLAAAVRAGELLRVSEQIVLAPGADDAAAAILARLDQPFTAAQAREALATTRRTVIPLLEMLDSAGVTQRLADDRRSAAARRPGRGGASARGASARRSGWLTRFWLLLAAHRPRSSATAPRLSPAR